MYRINVSLSNSSLRTSPCPCCKSRKRNVSKHARWQFRVMALASGVEHGIFGGAKAEQVSHLVAELGQVLPQVVEVLYCGLVRALHLLPRGRQVTMHQAAHDLLVVFVPFLLQAPPLLKNRTKSDS